MPEAARMVGFCVMQVVLVQGSGCGRLNKAPPPVAGDLSRAFSIRNAEERK
jgi:hypothetical protein